MPRYALAQINATVGDLRGNAKRILRALNDAAAHSPDLVIFPELTLAGYPPEDLLLKPGFFTACQEVMDELIPEISGAALVGTPRIDESGRRFNSSLLVRDGHVEAIYDKCLLPNYAVFDEIRYFTPGDAGLVFDVAGLACGVVICEDAWSDKTPANEEAAAGARVIACLSASPYHRGKDRTRQETFAPICRRNDVWFLYCNLVGGQDELVFDGGSFVMNPQGQVVARAKEFAEDLLLFDLPDLPRRIAGAASQTHGCGRCCGRSGDDQETSPGCSSSSVASSCEGASAGERDSAAACGGARDASCAGACSGGGRVVRRDDLPPLPIRETRKLTDQAEVYEALCLGVGDYVRKNGFRGVVIGLSGGIDSALTAAIAVDALGADNVWGVTMPSRYTSGETLSDAGVLAQNLGIRFLTLPIQHPYEAFSADLAPVFAEAASCDPGNLTDQNLQARLRAIYLMALSNKFGLIVLNTSNKSESAVGYGTIYGDMAGGYGAIKDLFKTQVWELSYYVNERHGKEVIPVSTIERVPTAELRENQEDRQSIPDYPVLDPILRLYVEEDKSLPEIIAAGHDAQTARAVVELVDRSEFKRRQSVMAPRVSQKAFGKDRRLPVTNRFRST